MRILKEFEEFTPGPALSESAEVSEGLRYHLDMAIPLSENIYRMGSDKYFELYREARRLRDEGALCVCEEDSWFLDTRIGEQAEFEGERVWLDIPMLDEADEDGVNEAEYRGKKVRLNSPKRGGPKKFYVYTMGKNGNVIKVAFGAAGGGGNLAVKLKDPKAKADFASRHQCEKKNDKTTPGYWSCRLPRYAKQLGLSGGGKWW
jgi:hypothetical protein